MHFPNGARVCFIGDSMTASNKPLSYTVDCYRKNFPDEQVRFFNCGTSGANINYALVNFEDDIAVHHPTHALIAFGINDSRRWVLDWEDETAKQQQSDEAYGFYKERLARLCDRLKTIGVEGISVCTPPPYDEFATDTDVHALPGCNAIMTQYAAFVRKFAEKNGYQLIDYNAYMPPLMEGQKLFNPDRVHPTDLGYFYMAKCIAEAQGLKMGEFYELPEYLSTWRDITGRLRYLHSAENNIIQNSVLATDEKMEFIREYSKRDNLDTYFINVCNAFLENKPREEELKKLLIEVYDRDILNL